MGMPVPASDLGQEVPEDDLPVLTAINGNANSSSPPKSIPSISQFLPKNPINQFIQGYAKQSFSDVGGAIGGGLRGLYDVILGRGTNQAVQDIQSTEQAFHRGLLAPQQGAEQTGATAAESNWNPLNWPGVALQWGGQKLGAGAEALGASPAISTALEIAPTAVAAFGPLVAKGDFKPYTVPIEEPGGMTGSAQSISAAAADGGMGATPTGAPEPLGPPVEGGLPATAHEARANVLANVGIRHARESALQGDAKSAAVDYQMTKYDQPAGRAAAQQFQSERDALANHTDNLIQQAGGTLGMDEDALVNRGQTIAQPFDMLRSWFEQRQRELYTEADSRSSGMPTTDLKSVDNLLQDPSFQNTLGARNQQGFLTAVKNQLDYFRSNNPQGFNPQSAEQFRQWLNSIWSNDNKWAVGQVKGAIDSDVLNAAGEDLYLKARAITQLKSNILDNPNGISQLFDVDPNNPINRATPYEKIPERLLHLSADQFGNVLTTLQNMPQEVQPYAQSALGEIKGQLLNKLYQAGTQTSRGVGSQVWGTDRVSQVLRQNAEKFKVAFANDPELQQGIENLANAGQILKVDQSYPGADAQAANAMKRGLISRALGHLGGSAGAAAGAALGGPLGAAAGGAVGESMGLSAGQKAAEKSALKSWGKRVTPIEKAEP